MTTAPTPTHRFDLGTRATAGTDDGWAVELSPDWGIGNDTLNGGYLLAVVASAVVAGSPHPHPVAMSATYLRPGNAGPATVEVRQARAGRTLANATAVLRNDGGDLVTAQATTATLPDSPDAAPSAPPVPGPDDCVDLSAIYRRKAPESGAGLMGHVDVRLDPATSGWLGREVAEERVLRAWVRFSDGRDPDPLALIAFSDILPPTGFAVGERGWAPTVQIQCLVRGLPAPGWCLLEARGHHVSDGWVDEDYLVWDSTGRLVAQSRQLARLAR